LLLTIFSQVDDIMSIHVPWKLEGANERIEQYRKATVSLRVNCIDQTAIPNNTVVQIEQTNHAFNFGCSLTQTWALHKQDTF